MSDSAVHVLAQVAARLAKIESAARAVVVEDAASASGEQGIRRAIAELADALNNGDVAAPERHQSCRNCGQPESAHTQDGRQRCLHPDGTLSDDCCFRPQVNPLAEALRDIKLRADSDASCEELEDAQADLRYIHARATAALRLVACTKQEADRG